MNSADWSQQLMDAVGAEALRLRLEQQQHWRLASAVRDGRQSQVDPDSHLLRDFRGDERLYEAEMGSFVKRLVGGAWARIETA